MKTKRSAAKSLTALSAVLLTGSLAGCAGGPASDASASIFNWGGGKSSATASSALKPAEAKAALVQLDSIPVKGRAPKTGYTRAQFGPAWADVDHNGCDTRNDILARDMSNETFKAGTHNCVVATGTLADKYTGKTINFVRGPKSSAVQIDHIVALSDAWQKGAQQIGAAKRLQLANDPLNLMAADGPANGQKSDSDASSWLPKNKSFRCEYVARQTAVKAKYKLWMTKAEHDTIAGILSTCK
jgi:hypothetical protein